MQKELTDENAILAKIGQGDQQAFGTLFHFYRNKVYGYAFSILQEDAAAEEIVQDVFMKLWLKRNSLTEINNFGGFLRTTARNETLNALKKISVQNSKYQIVKLNQSEIDSSTEQLIDFNETSQLLNEAIKKLPPQQKLIYNLCKIEGLDPKIVAEQLKISPLTLKVHLREAVKSIRIFLSTHDKLKTVPFLLLLLK